MVPMHDWLQFKFVIILVTDTVFIKTYKKGFWDNNIMHFPKY